MHYLRRRFHIFSVDVMAGADILEFWVRLQGNGRGTLVIDCRIMGGMAERPSGRGWRLLRAVCWGKGCFSGILMLV